MEENASMLGDMHTLVTSQLAAQVVETKAGAVLVTESDRVITDLEDVLEKHYACPKRAKGTSKHETVDSLIAHVKRMDLPAGECALFCASQGQPSLTAIYNYQPADRSRGAFGDHRATYAFPFSDAWKRWTAAASKPLSVLEFAELLENGIADVRDPSQPSSAPKLPGVRYASPAELLTLAEGLTVSVDLQVTEQRRRDDGTSTLQFAEMHETRDKAGAPVKVPNGFLLGIPVFLGGPPYAIPCRLRYRVKDKAVVWLLVLHDVEAAKREAVTEAARFVAQETALPLFFGASE